MNNKKMNKSKIVNMTLLDLYQKELLNEKLMESQTFFFEKEEEFHSVLIKKDKKLKELTVMIDNLSSETEMNLKNLTNENANKLKKINELESKLVLIQKVSKTESDQTKKHYKSDLIKRENELDTIHKELLEAEKLIVKLQLENADLKKIIKNCYKQIEKMSF